MMQASYTISEADYVAAMKLYARPRPGTVLVVVTVAVLFLLMALLGSPATSGIAMGSLAGAFAAVLIGRFLLMPFIAKRHYRAYAAIREPMTLELQSEGVRFSSPDGAGLIHWDKMLKWRQNDDYLLIYPMPRLYYIIPKSTLNKDFDLSALVKGLEQHLGRES